MWWLKIVNKLYRVKCDVVVEDPLYDSFPFDESYRGQNDAIKTVIENDRVLVCSHTGSGKSSIFLTAAHEVKQPTMIIEPRKFLQAQVGEYFGDFCLYGKGAYSCRFAPSAASAPCIKPRIKFVDGKKVRIFYVDNEEYTYPCNDCEYVRAVQTAIKTLSNKGIIVVNFGNFWRWLDKVTFVVIDEMDEFFRAVSSGLKFEHVDAEGEIKKMLEHELQITADEMKSLNTQNYRGAIQYNKLQAKQFRLKFLRENHELCFTYTRKNSVYVEIQPDKTLILLENIFKDKKLCGVTATPSDFI